MRLLSALAVLTLVVSACGGDGGGRPATTRERGDELEDVPLQAEEAPDGLEVDEQGSGPVDGLRDVLPPRRTAPGLPEVPKSLIRAFDAGYQRLFVDQDGGPRSAASSALRFAGVAEAESFLDHFRTIHEGTSEEPLLAAEGLGEEGYGWTHQVPGAQTTGYVWRRGDLVLTLTLGAGVGEAAPERVLGLATRIDDRLS